MGEISTSKRESMAANFSLENFENSEQKIFKFIVCMRNCYNRVTGKKNKLKNKILHVS